MDDDEEQEKNLKNILSYIFQYFNIFNTENIINQNNDDSDSSIAFFNNFKTIEFHEDYILNLIYLKDGRLSACFQSGLVKIFNKDTYDIDLSINEHSNKTVFFHLQLSNNNIVTCSADKTLKIIQLINFNKYKVIQTLIGHESCIYKALELKNGNIISCSEDGYLYIWMYSDMNNIFNLKNKYLIFEGNQNYFVNSKIDIILINDRELYCANKDKIIFLDISENFDELNIITKISGINMYIYGYSSIIIWKNFLLIGTIYKGIYLLNLNNHQLSGNVLNGTKWIYSILKLSNSNILIANKDEDSYDIREFKIEKIKNKIKLKEVRVNKNAHKNCIRGIIEIKNEFIASFSNDSTLKLWK